jgi:hypothetical protein
MLVGWGSSIDDHCMVTSPGVLSDVRDGASDVEISDAKSTWQTRASPNPGGMQPGIFIQRWLRFGSGRTALFISNLPASATYRGSFTLTVLTTSDGIESVTSSTGSGYIVNHGGVVSFVGSVTWWIPTSDGGSHIDRYQVKVTGTSVKCATPIRSCRLSGLSRNQTYTLVLKAHNAAGWSSSKTIRNVRG